MLKVFDIFPKFIDKSAKVRTFTGGLITLSILVWIFLLVYGEILHFLKPQLISAVTIDEDPILGPQKAIFNFDILVHTSCTNLHVDLFQNDGSIKTDIIDNINRMRLDSNGIPIETAMERRYLSKNYTKLQIDKSDYCGTCYAASEAGKCCNSCYDVMQAYRQKGWSFYGVDRWTICKQEGYLQFGNEKCRIKGSLKVKKGLGHFHIGLGSNSLSSSKKHLHDISVLPNQTNLSHSIHSFVIGDKLPDFQPPLTNIDAELEPDQNEFWSVRYFLHVVPSVYNSSKKRINSFRYSVMYSQRLSGKTKKVLPGIHFYYDFAPMKVITNKTEMTIRELITHIGGIIGGAFSFAAIIDALMFSALSTIRGKMQINKIS